MRHNLRDDKNQTDKRQNIVYKARKNLNKKTCKNANYVNEFLFEKQSADIFNGYRDREINLIL
jgi:hypothetical protein